MHGLHLGAQMRAAFCMQRPVLSRRKYLRYVPEGVRL